MVAYSFAPQFVKPIVAGRKRQTVRGHRKRHAHPGEPIHLYTGMRTRQCRKLLDCDPICFSVQPIRIVVDPHAPLLITAIELEGIPLPFIEIEWFARADGFVSDLDHSAHYRMGAFWLRAHGKVGERIDFDGVVVRWKAALDG